MTGRRVLRIMGWLGVTAIVVLSLLPGQDRPHVLEISQFEHLGAYFAVGIALALGYPERRSHAMIAIGLSALAAALEFIQLWIPGRSARIIDWGAGTLGAWAGIALALVLLWLQAWWRTPASPASRQRLPH